MVRTAPLLAALLAFHAATACAVTADELRGMADEKGRENMQRQGRANTGSLGSLLPSKEPAKSSKYGSPRAAAPRKAVPVATTTTSAAAPESAESSANLYVPPPRANTGASDKTIVSDAVAPSRAFGIRLGSWLNAELQRNTTSAESGTVELVLTSSYAGDRRTLPAGSVVFAEKSLNTSTKRMELVVTHGITPTGQEFEMRGIVFDPQKTPGLAGIFVLDKKQVAANSATKGTLAAVGAAVGQLTGGVGAAATTAATQSLANDTAQASDFNNTQQAVIYVSPQALIIRVERQF